MTPWHSDFRVSSIDSTVNRYSSLTRQWGLEPLDPRGNFACGLCAQLCLTVFHIEQGAWVCFTFLVLSLSVTITQRLNGTSVPLKPCQELNSATEHPGSTKMYLQGVFIFYVLYLYLCFTDNHNKYALVFKGLFKMVWVEKEENQNCALQEWMERFGSLIINLKHHRLLDYKNK